MLAGKADPTQNSAGGKGETRDECARLAGVEVESSAHFPTIPHQQGPAPVPGGDGIIPPWLPAGDTVKRQRLQDRISRAPVKVGGAGPDGRGSFSPVIGLVPLPVRELSSQGLDLGLELRGPPCDGHGLGDALQDPQDTNIRLLQGPDPRLQVRQGSPALPGPGRPCHAFTPRTPAP